MPASLSRVVQQRLDRERVQQDRRDDLRCKLQQDNIGYIRGESDAHVEALRRQRQEAAERRELFTDYAYVKAEQEKEKRRQISELEQNLADELERRKAQEVRKETVRRQIIDGSDELRVLKEKLGAAAVNKVRARQLLEKQERDQVEMHRQAMLDGQAEAARLEDEEQHWRHQQEKARWKNEVKQMNQEQIAQKEREREKAIQDFRVERDHVEELVAKIAAEDEKEMFMKQQKKEEVRRSIYEYQVQAEEARKDEQMKQAQEDARIEAFAQQKRIQEERLAEEQRQREVEKQRIQRELMNQAVEKHREAEEMDRLREDLHREEKEDEWRRKELFRAQERLEMQREMRREYQASLASKERARQNEAAKEHHLREELLAKFAEDERLEQMSAQKRRMKLQDYKRDIDRQLEARRGLYEEERKKELDELERLKSEEAEREKVVEQERLRLLEEHGSDLRNFLPKGAIAKETDFDVVGLDRPGPHAFDQYVARKPAPSHLGIPPYPASVARMAPPQSEMQRANKEGLRTFAPPAGNDQPFGSRPGSAPEAVGELIGQAVRGSRPQSSGPGRGFAGRPEAPGSAQCGSRPREGGDAGIGPIVGHSARGGSRPPSDAGGVGPLLGGHGSAPSRPPNGAQCSRSNSRARPGDGAGMAEIMGMGVSSARANSRPRTSNSDQAPELPSDGRRQMAGNIPGLSVFEPQFQPPSRGAAPLPPGSGGAAQRTTSRGAVGGRQAWM
eukprot:TRINITY_DN107082_c0_g1_i1.p1 TRINITY_DN107082_c0_g1~~TRINITY_DN107082_c0_g1_i1.p1  ORF type:complete len:733 (-),score=211.70 TRINITY_DN107082_c0_g1_i1:31-2229(-)